MSGQIDPLPSQFLGTCVCIDRNRTCSGQLEEEDFTARSPVHGPLNDLWAQIASLDTDGDGHVSPDEFNRGILDFAMQMPVRVELVDNVVDVAGWNYEGVRVTHITSRTHENELSASGTGWHDSKKRAGARVVRVRKAGYS